jgi:DsbC/DsbD-like thiol-disulfide interchange protein
LGVASLSYDSAAVLKAFGDRVGITYPMLSDADSKIIRAFGILNEAVPQGTPFYGIPHPGTYVVDAQGIVRAKFFEPDFKERYTAGSMLLKTSPEAARQGWKEAETRHLTLRYRASDDTVSGGDRATLALAVTLKPGMHVYAPGVTGGYIPVEWRMGPGAWKAQEAQWPASKMLRLEVIKETVPVYEGQFAASRDLTFAQQKELEAASSAGQVKVEGAFRYQACDERECYPPVTVPLEWSFRVAPHDSQRAPEALRRK